MGNKDIVRAEIIVENQSVGVRRFGEVDFISLTDLASKFNSSDPSGVIRNWMSNKNSFDFYGLWEELNNPNFNSVEFHRIKSEEAALNRFTMTPKIWKKEFHAIGIIPSAGKYSIGTFAHPDIAFEFASWLSPEFKLYLIHEFERLKQSEMHQYRVEWHANRMLAKASYAIHTDAIKACLIPSLTDAQKKFAYANEADILNVAVFGVTSREWREQNPDLAKSSNLRDHANLIQLIILSNIEVINSELIKQGLSQAERLERLNASARSQLALFAKNRNIAKLEQLEQTINKPPQLDA